MSNAIIKQQGNSPIVADNIWEIRLGAGSFILGALAGTLVTAAVGRLAAKGDALPTPPTPRGWPVNFAHRGGAKVVPENTIEGFREGFAMGGGVVECDVHASAEAPSSLFMTRFLIEQPMAADPWLRKPFRNCRALTRRTASAPTVV
jgi:glycerophosphoryl diester phosphodiesterase